MGKLEYSVNKHLSSVVYAQQKTVNTIGFLFMVNWLYDVFSP